MSAGMPPSTAKGATTNNRWWMIVAGSAGILVIGGLASQFLLARPGSAATEEEPGKATVSNARKTPGERAPLVAKVGKFGITQETLANECVTRFGKEVLDDLINRAMIQQACEAQNVMISADEVEAEILNISKKYNLEPDQWQQMLQAERNITPQQYRESVIWPMLALRKLAEGKAQDELTEADVQKEFERQFGPRVKVRMILQDNLRRAKDCWEKCKHNPEEFDKYAQEYSIDPNSRALGGTIPPIPMHSGNETLEKVAFKLKDGEISGVVEVSTLADGGARFAILKCEGRTEQLVDNLEDVRDQIVDQLKERKVQESVAKVYESVKEQTVVHNYLTNTVSGPDPQAVNPAARTTSSNARQSKIQQTSGEKVGSSATGNRPKVTRSREAATK